MTFLDDMPFSLAAGQSFVPTVAPTNTMRRPFDRATRTTSSQHAAIHSRRSKMACAADDRSQWVSIHRQPPEAAIICTRTRNHRSGSKSNRSAVLWKMLSTKYDTNPMPIMTNKKFDVIINERTEIKTRSRVYIPDLMIFKCNDGVNRVVLYIKKCIKIVRESIIEK